MKTILTKTISARKHQHNRPTWGLRNIASLTERILKPIKKEKGFVENKLAADWHTIVGAELSVLTFPDRVISTRGKYAEETIHIKAASGAAAVLLQTQTSVILERVNTYLGTKTCKSIRIKQGMLSPRNLEARTINTKPLNEKNLEINRALVNQISNGVLCDALSRLGARLMDRSSN